MNLYNIRKELNMGKTLTNMNLKVTYYSRVSTDHLEQQKSLKNQIEYFDEMIKNNKCWTYVTGYVDDGISGTVDYKRDNFMKMITDAKEGKFDLIITKEISRFSRNTLDSIKYTRELLSFGVAVLFINDNINTALPDAELRLTIMASLAQDEVRRLSERVKFGMNRSIKNGTILGNNMHYGYKKDKATGNLIIIENEAELIRRLYELYAINKLSLPKIAQIFNDENIRTNRNKKWCISTLSRMIKNPKYKGYYCGKKTEVVDYMTKKVIALPKKDWVMYEDNSRIPPIVTEELWQRANRRLLSKKENENASPKSYPLSKKIYCFEHNQPFYRRKQCKSTDDITWTCAQYLKHGKKYCDSPNIREREIYTIFTDIINYLEIDFRNVTNILLSHYLDNKKVNTKSKTKELKTKKDKIQLKKERLLDLSIDGNISTSEFNKRNKAYNEVLNKLETEINLLEKNNSNMSNSKEKLEIIINKKLNKKSIKEKLLDLLLDKIVVSKINNSKEKIELKIYLKKTFQETHLNIKKDYAFKRGYNTTGTRRYTVIYQVYLT